MAVEGVRIDELPLGLASRDHVLPAMQGMKTVKLSVGQILDLADVPGEVISGATAKEVLVDDDLFGIADSADGQELKKTTLAQLVSSVFHTARKIANGYFLSSFRLWDVTDNTKGLAFDLSGVPAGTVRAVRVFSLGTLAVLQDQKPAANNGGSSVAGWQTRTLNTEVSDPDNIVTLSANQITPTVDCWCEAESTAFLVNQSALRIWNVTDSVEVARGVVAYSGEAAPGYSITPSVAGRLIAGKTYRIEMYAGRAQGSTGLGVSLTDGTNVYTNVILRGIA